MDIKLKRVTRSNKSILYRLLQFSLFEESGTDGNKINSKGYYDYRWFDNYFTDKTRVAFIVYCDNEIAGFVMINTYTQIVKSGHSIAEFMIMPYMRNKHIGSITAKMCFDMFDGLWEVSPSFGSDVAFKFWQKVISDYTSNDYKYQKRIFVFSKNK